MMYYGLRGVEAHNNRTEPTIISEDNSTMLIIILMIIYSRFTPAGDLCKTATRYR